jgi:hypothetical protein
LVRRRPTGWIGFALIWQPAVSMGLLAAPRRRPTCRSIVAALEARPTPRMNAPNHVLHDLDVCLFAIDPARRFTPHAKLPGFFALHG